MNFKPLFNFSRNQRKGVFLLLLIIFTLQLVCVFWKPSENEYISSVEIQEFNAQIDSLRAEVLKEKQPKIYPFNPNFITDYKGYTLGMSPQEIDRLHQFRNKNQWINSAQQFQQVTQISDSLFKNISPYFKFPDWVTYSKTKPKTSFSNQNTKTNDSKIDLNTANAQQLTSVYGIGDKRAKQIIQLREKLGGFHSLAELGELYGVDDQLISKFKTQLQISKPRPIQTINLNTANKDQLVTIKYIDYEIAYQIIEYRTLHESFKSLEELKKVKQFPNHKFEIIALYLHL